MFLYYTYFFCFLMIISSFLVLLSINPVQSILYLILAFVLSSCVFLMVGAEFLSILLIVVYIGAVSILFLFVVMMLNLRLFELYSDLFSYIPIGAFIGFFFFFQLYFSSLNDFGFFFFDVFIHYDFFYFWSNFLWNISNVFFFSCILFNFFYFFIFLASLILLVAMFGVIVLTVDFEYRSFVKQKTYAFGENFYNDTFTFWKLN